MPRPRNPNSPNKPVTVCIYWFTEEIAERFTYNRFQTSYLLNKLKSICGKRCHYVPRYGSRKKRYYSTGDLKPTFKVTVVNED